MYGGTIPFDGRLSGVIRVVGAYRHTPDGRRIDVQWMANADERQATRPRMSGWAVGAERDQSAWAYGDTPLQPLSARRILIEQGCVAYALHTGLAFPVPIGRRCIVIRR